MVTTIELNVVLFSTRSTSEIHDMQIPDHVSMSDVSAISMLCAHFTICKSGLRAYMFVVKLGTWPVNLNLQNTIAHFGELLDEISASEHHIGRYS
jgi:hypothetical protein